MTDTYTSILPSIHTYPSIHPSQKLVWHSLAYILSACSQQQQTIYKQQISLASSSMPKVGHRNDFLQAKNCTSNHSTVLQSTIMVWHSLAYVLSACSQQKSNFDKVMERENVLCKATSNVCSTDTCIHSQLVPNPAASNFNSPNTSFLCVLCWFNIHSS